MSQSDVFVDYLDCTYSPEDNPVRDVERVLESLGGFCDRPAFGSKASVVWTVGFGKVVVNENSRWVRISTSGLSLEVLRDGGQFEEYVNALGSSPHKVTRIDVTLDVYTDAPPLISKLRARYPQYCSLSQKPVKTKWIGACRSDGVETGSFYVGDRKKSEVSACCYDKQEEAYAKRGEMIPPTMRYEIRCKSGVRPTLADALDPTPMFWHYAAGTLLDSPGQVRAWVQGREFNPWVHSFLPPQPAEKMIDRVMSSPELGALVRLADDCGPQGRVMLERLLSDRLDQEFGRIEREKRDLAKKQHLDEKPRLSGAL